MSKEEILREIFMEEFSKLEEVKSHTCPYEFVQILVDSAIKALSDNGILDLPG